MNCFAMSGLLRSCKQRASIVACSVFCSFFMIATACSRLSFSCCCTTPLCVFFLECVPLLHNCLFVIVTQAPSKWREVEVVQAGLLQGDPCNEWSTPASECNRGRTPRQWLLESHQQTATTMKHFIYHSSVDEFGKGRKTREVVLLALMLQLCCRLLLWWF